MDSYDYLQEAAFNFLQAVATEYGEDEAHKLFKVIGEEVSEDIAKRLLYVMLQRDPSNVVVLISANNANLIRVIKSVRDATSLGLKETKDLVESTMDHNGKPARIECQSHQAAQQLRQKFHELGVEYS